MTDHTPITDVEMDEIDALYTAGYEVSPIRLIEEVRTLRKLLKEVMPVLDAVEADHPGLIPAGTATFNRHRAALPAPTGERRE